MTAFSRSLRSPPFPRFSTAIAITVFAFASSCAKSGLVGPPDGGDGDGGTKLPAPLCVEAKPWAPNTPTFVDATERWGLNHLDVTGLRLSAVDFDGDGWPDLVVRAVGDGVDDSSGSGARRVWLLRNAAGKGFEDVTISSGFTRRRTAGEEHLGRAGEVVAFADVDNDGDLDAWVGLSTRNPSVVRNETSELLLNDGAGRFELAPEGAHRFASGVSTPAGASFADVNLDGAVDLWVPHHGYDSGEGFIFQQDRLLIGDGTGAFSDVTDVAGLTTLDWLRLDDIDAARAHSRAWSSAACDLDGDGLPELLAASYGRAPNHLWKAHSGADAGVIYENLSVESGYAYDDDRTWEDNQFARCHCLANPTAQGCADVPPPLIACATPNWNHGSDRRAYRMGGNSGTTVCADLDNDGHFDLLTTEIRHWWAGSGSDMSEILRNAGERPPRFERPGREATGLVIEHDDESWDEGHMTAAVFDFDNDGWPDIHVGASDYPGNRGLLFRQVEPLKFERVDPSVAIDHPRSHGVAVADFDRDGDLDVVVGHSRMRCELGGDCLADGRIRYFENVLEHSGNWLQLRLEGGAGTNRAAIGARVTVEAGGVTQTQDVGGGHGHYGMQHDLALHFGIGSSCEARVTIRWPDFRRTTESFTLPAGHRFHWKQGAEPEVWSL